MGDINMGSIWQIILGVVTSLGGIGVIFAAVVCFTSNFIAERLQKKYDLKLNEEIEKYKAGIENKKYISKTKFDAEFALYRSLSKAFFDMVKNVSILIPQGLTSVPADKEAKKKFDENNYKNAFSSVVLAQDELNSNAAFIPEDIYKAYDEINRLCKRQLNEFEQRWNVGYLASPEEKETLPHEAYERTGEINDKFMDLNNKIREYLDKLDVMD